MRAAATLATLQVAGGSPQRQKPAAGGALRVSAVLAPADGGSSRPTAPPRSIGHQLLSWASSRWDGSTSRAPIGDGSYGSTIVAELQQATEKAERKADALDAKREAEEHAGAVATSSPDVAAPLPDIRSFLRPSGVMEARYVRVLSSLCALTYHLDKLTPSALARRHRLKLVSTSKICELRLRETPPNPTDALLLGDAMAADPALVEAALEDIAAGEERGAAGPAMQVLARVEPLTSADLAVVTAGEAGAGLSPVDRVAASLASAASAASAAAQGVYTAAVPYAGPLANNITTFTAGVAASLPVRNVAAQLQSAAAVGHSSAVATVATVSAALESTWGRDRLPKECQSPTEWFIADDEQQHVRIFVIQGSDNLDHWRVNLTFDPVPFEDPALGVRVHRGVYEAAQQLYDRFLPLITDHLATSPFAKVAFTGHSLGGSLGAVLMLMYVRRGVLPPSAVSPVYTFGAPSVLCDGAGGACACPDDGSGSSPSGGSSAGGKGCGVLRALGLPESAVRNVLMHRDIVPRAFACDYSLVADLLKRVSESFRTHTCLSSSRTVMFDFVGKVLVLQPEADASFVAKGEGLHPMLPPAPGLWVLRDPTPFNTVTATLQHDASFVREAVQQAISNLPSPTAAATARAVASSPAPAPPATSSTSLTVTAPGAADVPAPAKAGKRGLKQEQFVPASAREAAFALMNSPHPLDILADPGAYGDLGAISRYHNPDNYTRALGSVLRHRRAWRRLVANAGSVGIRYCAPALDPSQLRAAGAHAAAPPAASDAAAGVQAVADRRMSPGGKQSLPLRRLSPRSGRVA